MSNHENEIQNIADARPEVGRRKISYKSGNIDILYIKHITDKQMLIEYVIKPIMRHIEDMPEHVEPAEMMNNFIYVDNCELERDFTALNQKLNSGLTLIIIDQKDEYISAELKKFEQRSIPIPELNYSVMGPRDCFIESLPINLSLIQKRITDENMMINMITVGERSKSKLAILHIKDIANETMVNDISSRLGSVRTDIILDTSELQEYLMNNPYGLYPQTGICERADMACAALMEGKVLILLDGSATALIAPKVLSEFLASSEDTYNNRFFSVSNKILRIAALLIATTITSFYVIVNSYNFDLLPPDYIYLMASARSAVPFSPLTSTLILEFVMELLRETLIRVPRQIGPAIGIVGAIIIGQAAIVAGIFSPLLLILVSIGFLASYAIPDHTLMNAMRVMKFAAIILTGIFGIYGFTLALCLIITNMASVNSFGVPYLAPVSPYNSYSFSRIFYNSKKGSHRRPGYLRNKDNVRSK